MRMNVRYDRKFRRQYDKADAKIRSAFIDRLRLFCDNPRHPLLHNHLLTGSYQEYRSINVTGDWRAIYMESRSATGEIIIEFKLFGTHSQLYR